MQGSRADGEQEADGERWADGGDGSSDGLDHWSSLLLLEEGPLLEALEVQMQSGVDARHGEKHSTALIDMAAEGQLEGTVCWASNSGWPASSTPASSTHPTHVPATAVNRLLHNGKWCPARIMEAKYTDANAAR